MLEWDPGPKRKIKTVFEKAPVEEYRKRPEKFRLEWGPIYYRGRLDGSARVLVIGQDPGADENVARKILIGDAGQRVQGFLTKQGITKSYVMVNASLYSIYGQFDEDLKSFMDIAAVKEWRNLLLDSLASRNIQAVLAFGRAAEHAVNAWPGAKRLKDKGRIVYLTHPTAHIVSQVFANWNKALSQLDGIITPDTGHAVDMTPYSGRNFDKYLARIPLCDLGFGAPSWLGAGDTAVRVSPGKSIPKTTRHGILWTAIEDNG